LFCAEPTDRAMRDGDLSEGTPLQHVAYVLELDAWLREHRVTIL
jgi:hypothetical protein